MRQAAWRRSALSLVVVLGLARSASAQAAASPLVEGARARVAAPALGPSPRIVRVVATRGDTIVVRPDDAAGFEVSLPLASITGVEVSEGRRPRKAHFARVGLVTGLVVGGLGGALAYKDPCESEPAVCAGFLHETRQSATISGAFSGGVLGAVGGAVAGALWPAERWSRSSFPLQGAQVRLLPGVQHRRRLEVALRVGAR